MQDQNQLGMEEHPGIRNKGSFTLLRSEGEKGESSYQNLANTVVIAERLPSWSCGFMMRTTATVRPTVNRSWRPCREGIFFLLLPSDQLRSPFCRSQLEVTGQRS